MAIATTDLVLYGSANRPVDDTSTTGGAVDLLQRPEFTQLLANDTIEIVSTAAGDTALATLIGRNAAGALVTDTKTMTGVTPIAFTGTFERVLRCSIAANAVGTVTVRRAPGDELIGTIPIGERGFYAMFHDSASEAGIAIRFEKCFWRNSNGSLTLNSADVTLTADPDARIRIGLSPTVGDSATATNRKTAPASVTFSDDSVVLTVPGGVLAATASIGMWVEQNLPASDPAHRSSFTTRLRGTST